MADRLCQELLEELLVRIPLDDPASLVNSALVCKEWALLVSGPGFRTRLREFYHLRPPPILGIITTVDLTGYPQLVRYHPEESEGEDRDGEDSDYESEVIANFHTTSTFRPLPGASRPGWHAVDSNHGRVLLHPLAAKGAFDNVLWVWCPLTGEQLELPRLPRCPTPERWSAALVCAADAEDGGACDHLDGCHRKPFFVVFVGNDKYGTFASTYSSVDGAWGEPVSAKIPNLLEWVKTVPPVRLGNDFYFLYQVTSRILKYNMATHEFSVIDAPSPSPGCSHDSGVVLMSMEGGILGFAAIRGNILPMWAREVDAEGATVWVSRQSLRLRSDGDVLPYLISSVPGWFGFFVSTASGRLAFVNPKMGVYKRLKLRCDKEAIFALVPYVTHCLPVVPAELRRRWIEGDGPNTGA